MVECEEDEDSYASEFDNSILNDDDDSDTMNENEKKDDWKVYEILDKINNLAPEMTIAKTNEMIKEVGEKRSKKAYILPFLEDDLEEKFKRWVRKEFKTFKKEARLSIHHWKDSCHKRMYKLNQKRVRDYQEEYFSNHNITEVVRVTTN
nr:hypothetical protein [Tanacetum cinerariifolium]